MHYTTERFWQLYQSLPKEIQEKADKCFTLLKQNLKHPSLHFKRTGKFWSVRIGLSHRALAMKEDDDFIWVWIGSHDEYERIIGYR